MKVVVQRSKESRVIVDNQIVGNIEHGLVVLVGFTHNDTIKEIDYIVKKIVNLRIFDDEEGVMNKSLLDTKGSILSISQFTLYADTQKGRRPSYIEAMKPELAIKMYELFNEQLKEHGVEVEQGVFGADMRVEIINDGPVTIVMESEL